jgi:hypothetical protein
VTNYLQTLLGIRISKNARLLTTIGLLQLTVLSYKLLCHRYKPMKEESKIIDVPIGPHLAFPNL